MLNRGRNIEKGRVITRRMFILAAAKILLFAGISSRLYSLQISDREKYEILSDKLEAEKQALMFEEDELKKSVQRAYFGMKENLKLIDALLTAIQSAKIELDANIKSSKAGIRRQLDVLIAQQKLIKVQNDLIQARVNVILFWAQLNMLSGNLDGETISFLNNLIDM